MPAPLTERRRTVTRDDVVRAALDILDEDGLDGLTMANVAGRVGFTTMAVYRHVKNRDDLIAAAVELVLGEISGGDPEMHWLDGVEAWMNDVRACLLAHPWAATRLGTRREGASAPWARTVQILGRHVSRGPLSARDQARALAWTTRLTVGVLILELGAPMSEAAGRRRRAAGRALADELARLSDDDLFADAVEQTRRFLLSMAG